MEVLTLCILWDLSIKRHQEANFQKRSFDLCDHCLQVILYIPGPLWQATYCTTDIYIHTGHG